MKKTMIFVLSAAFGAGGAGLAAAQEPAATVTPQEERLPETRREMQDEVRRQSVEDPRIGAEVRTAGGDLVGQVTDIRYATPESSVVSGYIVTPSDRTGQPSRTLFFTDDEARISGLDGDAVLIVDRTRSEIEAMPGYEPGTDRPDRRCPPPCLSARRARPPWL